MTHQSSLALHHGLNVKPGLSPRILKALIVSFPIASAMWAGIIYSASRLAR